MQAYDQGDKLRCAASFTNLAGVAIDPDLVLFDLWVPGIAKQTFTYGAPDGRLIKSSVGNYYLDVPLDVPGQYHWKLYGTGNGMGAATGEFIVKADVW